MLFRWPPGVDECFQHVTTAGARIKELDNFDSRAYSALGTAYSFYGRRDQAITELRRSIELNPNNATTLTSLAIAEAFSGLVCEGRRHAELALRLSPKDLFAGSNYLALSIAAFVEDDLDAAVKWGEQAVNADPNYPIRRALMIAYWGELGDPPAAQPHIEQLTKIAPDYISSLFRGEAHLFKEAKHNERMLEGLRKSELSLA